MISRGKLRYFITVCILLCFSGAAQAATYTPKLRISLEGKGLEGCSFELYQAPKETKRTEHPSDSSAGSLEMTSNSFELEIQIPGTCPHPHSVFLKTASGGFVDRTARRAGSGHHSPPRIDYKAELSWGKRSIVLNTDSKPGKDSQIMNIDSPYQGTMLLTIVIDKEKHPNVEQIFFGKDYTDTLIIKFDA